MSQKKFVVCVDGVYVKDGKILLPKRNVEPFKGFWHVVGGHVEENETLKEAVKREFKEETGLDVTVGGVVAGRIEETFDRVKIIAAFEVTSAEGEICLNSENESYGWFDEILAILFTIMPVPAKLLTLSLCGFKCYFHDIAC